MGVAQTLKSELLVFDTKVNSPSAALIPSNRR
jgi:hypothetical protein